MLVLTRKIDEGIIIGDNILIKVVEVKGGQVRIGIEAPAQTKIYRKEIYDQIVQQNRAATQWNPALLDDLGSTLKISGKK